MLLNLSACQIDFDAIDWLNYRTIVDLAEYMHLSDSAILTPILPHFGFCAGHHVCMAGLTQLQVLAEISVHSTQTNGLDAIMGDLLSAYP